MQLVILVFILQKYEHSLFKSERFHFNWLTNQTNAKSCIQLIITTQEYLQCHIKRITFINRFETSIKRIMKIHGINTFKIVYFNMQLSQIPKEDNFRYKTSQSCRRLKSRKFKRLDNIKERLRCSCKFELG